MQYSIDGKIFYQVIEGFTYFPAPSLTGISPKNIPTTASFLYINGNNFRSDFSGSNLICKISNQKFPAKFINTKQIKCLLNNNIKFKINSGQYKFAVYLSLNGQDFLHFNNLFINFYNILAISPLDGPISGNSIVL